MSIQERVKAVDVLAIGKEAPLIVDAGESVATTLERMREHRAGCALVTSDGKLVGIFTERDVLRTVVDDANATTGPVSAVMTPDPETVSEQTPIRELWPMLAGATAPTPVSEPADADAVARFALSSARARIHLGWSSWTSLADGLAAVR